MFILLFALLHWFKLFDFLRLELMLSRILLLMLSMLFLAWFISLSMGE